MMFSNHAGYKIETISCEAGLSVQTPVCQPLHDEQSNNTISTTVEQLAQRLRLLSNVGVNPTYPRARGSSRRIRADGAITITSTSAVSTPLQRDYRFEEIPGFLVVYLVFPN